MGREDIASHMREIIHAFKMAASRISRVISSLKEFSRSDEALQRRPIALGDVIQGAMVIVGAQIRKTVSTIDVSIAFNLPPIEGHFQRLEQVVANLLINAHQAIPPGQKGTIAIRARFIAWMDAVVVEVEDNGRGMAREILDHLFHPFFTTRRDSGGTGLGLSISYGIVKEHGGQIGVISQIGAGTKFTLFLPVEGGTYSRLSPSILCIDQDDPFSKGLAAHLPHVQLWPVSAGDTVETIVAYLREHPEIDIVLSEIRLPALNGWDLLRGLKERFPLLNIILYSSDPTDCEAPHDVIGDARCILKKPFTADHLVKIILEIGRQRL
jgi:CheY-like chemotaxis protein